MKKIEIDKDIISVPEGWNEISLGDYETWFQESPKSRKEQVELVARICKMDVNKLLNYPLDVFNLITETITFIFSPTKTEPAALIEIEGIKYAIPVEESLSTAAWIDIEEAQKDQNNILSTILAIVCQPVGQSYDPQKTDERKKMFAEMEMNRVLPLLSFFLHYKKIFEKHSAMYSMLKEVANQYVKTSVTFPKGGDGIKLLSIWPRVRYYVSMMWLRYRLRKCLHSLGMK